MNITEDLAYRLRQLHEEQQALRELTESFRIASRQVCQTITQMTADVRQTVDTSACLIRSSRHELSVSTRNWIVY